MSDHIAPKKPRRVRFAPAAIAAGAVGALLLTVSLSGTLSGFTAAINNTTDTASSGVLTMSETNAAGPVTCTSTDSQTVSATTAAQCSTINKYGATTLLVPGGSGAATTVTIKNTGTVLAKTFTMVPAACTQSAVASPSGTATDLCNQMIVTVTSGGAAVFTGTLTQFAAATSSTTPALTMPVTQVAAGASVPFTFTVSLPSSLGNTYQNLQVSQPIQFNFAS